MAKRKLKGMVITIRVEAPVPNTDEICSEEAEIHTDSSTAACKLIVLLQEKVRNTVRQQNRVRGTK